MKNTIDRRRFLARPRFPPRRQSSKPRVKDPAGAFVGVGNRGSYLLQKRLRVKGFQVVAVCDIIPERAEAAARLVAPVRRLRQGVDRLPQDARRAKRHRHGGAATPAGPIRTLTSPSSRWARTCTPRSPWRSPRRLSHGGPSGAPSQGIMQVGFQLRTTRTATPPRSSSTKAASARCSCAMVSATAATCPATVLVLRPQE